jgi:hypothetical protein
MTSKGGQRPRSSYLLPRRRHDATKRTGDDDEGHGKITSRRTVYEPPLCQQCRHDRHCSIMACHTATLDQDHDEDHTRMCDDVRTRRACLQAKLTCLSLPRAHDHSVRRTPFSICNMAPGLYKRATKPPIQGNKLSRFHSGIRSPHSSYIFPLAYTPYCKRFRAFNRGTQTRTLCETGHRASA